MRTVEEIGDDRIVWDYPPETVRDMKYPGATLQAYQANLQRSLRVDVRWVKTYALTNPSGYRIAARLTEIP